MQIWTAYLIIAAAGINLVAAAITLAAAVVTLVATRRQDDTVRC